MRHRSAETHKRRVAFWIALAICLAAASLRPHSGNAHEPITTKVMFTKEIVRTLQRSCLGCHRPGGIAMSLATYEEARPWAKAIKEEILEKRMPPWHAVKGYGDFRNAPPITQREIDLIVNWVEGGAPKGDEKDLPSGPLYSNDWPLGAPDLVLPVGPQQTIDRDADETRTITVSPDLKSERWLRAIDLRPGNGTVVHCATIYLESQSGKDAGSGASGYAGGATEPGTVLGTWMPGQRAMAFPDGTGLRIPAISRLTVKIHYRGTGEAVKDESAIGLYFAKNTARRPIQDMALTNPGAVIPTGARLWRMVVSAVSQDDCDVLAVRPQVHPLLSSIQATAYRPDGSEEVLLWARGYQFDWQPAYYFKKPVALPKGTRVEVIAYFDNSEDNKNNPNNPPKELKWADLSSEPMCTLLVANVRSLNE